MAKREPDFIMVQGDTSTPWTGTLKDALGLVDLTGYELDLIATLKGSTTRVIDDGEASLTLAADQVADKGEFSYSFTAPQAAFAVGDYEVTFKGTDAGAKPVTWPTHHDKSKKFLWWKIVESQ